MRVVILCSQMHVKQNYMEKIKRMTYVRSEMLVWVKLLRVRGDRFF